jgi:outer membrane protein TolC
MPAQLLRRRPDIRSAELLAVAQSARIGIAKADLYPSFSILGVVGAQTSGGSTFTTATGKHKTVADFDEFGGFYSFGPSIQWPILNYGRIRNDIRVQDARFQQSLIFYQDTVLRAVQEVEDGLTGFLKSQETAAALQIAVDASRRSVDIAFVQYREGAVDFQRVLDAQRSLLQEETSLVQSHSSNTTSLIALYKALGGGWEIRRGQPFVPVGIQDDMQKRTDWGQLLPAPLLPKEKDLPPPASRTPFFPQPDW